MNEFPPVVLVETWLHVLTSKNQRAFLQKKVIIKKIQEHFGSIELAQLYVEQSKDEEVEIHFL